MEEYKHLIKKQTRQRQQQKRRVAKTSATLSRQLQSLSQKTPKMKKAKVKVSRKK